MSRRLAILLAGLCRFIGGLFLGLAILLIGEWLLWYARTLGLSPAVRKDVTGAIMGPVFLGLALLFLGKKKTKTNYNNVMKTGN